MICVVLYTQRNNLAQRKISKNIVIELRTFVLTARHTHTHKERVRKRKPEASINLSALFHSLLCCVYLSVCASPPALRKNRYLDYIIRYLPVKCSFLILKIVFLYLFSFKNIIQGVFVL